MNTRPLVITARILAAIASALALLAAVSGIGVAAASPSETVMVESWRTVGFFTFAALFAYLAFRPAQSVALWVIVLANKLVLTITALLLGSAAGAATSAAWDGALVLILAVGLVLVLVARRRSGEGVQRG